MGDLFRRLAGYFRIEHALALVPICGFALYDSVFSAFSSILAALGEHYPEVSTTTIQMILSVPPMISIPGTLLSGFLAAYIHRKYIAEFSLVVIFIGGMIPALFPNPNIYAMFACSACIGLGQGLLHPLANSLICTTWDDEQRSRVLGFKQSFNYIGAAAVSLLVGYLALRYWGNAFFVYLGVIPVFILTHIALPKGQLEHRLIAKESKLRGMMELFTPKTIFLFALFFCAMVCTFAWNSNIAMLVQEKGLGTTADISKITSSVSIISFILALSYGEVVKFLGRYTLSVGFALMACGMLIASFGNHFLVILLGGLLFGIGVGIQEISTVYYISLSVDKRLVTVAISIAVSCVSLGASISPLVIRGIEGALFGTGSASMALLVAGCGHIVLALVEGIGSKFRADKRQEYVPDYD